jgi:hypothetical protein
VSEWLLFNIKSAIFHLYYGENKLIFNEMMMRSDLYQTNTLSWIFFIVLAHWNNSPPIDMKYQCNWMYDRYSERWNYFSKIQLCISAIKCGWICSIKWKIWKTFPRSPIAFMLKQYFYLKFLYVIIKVENNWKLSKVVTKQYIHVLIWVENWRIFNTEKTKSCMIQIVYPLWCILVYNQ